MVFTLNIGALSSLKRGRLIIFIRKSIMPTPVTEQAPKIEDAVSNSYLQQENDLVQNIIATIKTSPEIFKKVEIWENSKGHGQRVSSELEQFKKNKVDLKIMIEELKGDFGSEDSLADLKKLEEFELKLKAVEVAIPLLEQKLHPENLFSKQIRRDKEDAESAIAHAVNKINDQLQEDIDAKVNDLLQTFSMYRAAIERVKTEQTLIPQKLLMGNTLRGILPEIKGLQPLLPLNLKSMHY